MASVGSDLETNKKIDMGTSNLADSTSNDEKSTTDSIQEKQESVSPEPPEEDPKYETGLRLVLVMFTILMSTLLAALEIGIISTAIPRITDEFHRLSDVGWYGSATFVVAGPSSPMWGKAYKYFNVKCTYLASVAFYVLGGLVAATAPSSAAVIVGRAFQGVGGSGTIGGSALIINYVAEPKKRPVMLGIWMGVFMVSTILGPLVGGAFTSGVSWRWCFWINLPLGGLIVVLCLLFLRIPKHIKPTPATRKEIILQLDIPGFALLLASLVCLALALQRGGQAKPWNAGSVVATLVLWILLTIAFFIIEWIQGEHAMVPFRLIKPRIVWTNVLYCFISSATLFQVMFYLPIYLQSIHGQTAVISGVNTLPNLAFFALGSMISGVVVGKTRYLQPYQLIGALIMTAGVALLYTLDTHSSRARYIGPQVLFGLGIGLVYQIPMTATQGFSKHEDVASTTGIILMAQTASGAYFVTVAQSLFANRLLQNLQSDAPNIDASQVLSIGVSDIQKAFRGETLAAVINAYMVGIKAVFTFALAAAAFTCLLTLIIPMKKLPNPESKETEKNDAKV